MQRTNNRLRKENGVWSCAGLGLTRKGETPSQAFSRWQTAVSLARASSRPPARRRVSEPLDRVPAKVLAAIAANADRPRTKAPACPAYPESLVQKLPGTVIAPRAQTPDLQAHRQLLAANQRRAREVQPRLASITSA